MQTSGSARTSSRSSASAPTAPSPTEYTAQETYLCRDLTEQEAVEQFDGLIRSAEIESMDDKERIAQLEQQTVDNATAIAALYEAQATAVSADTEGKE